MIEQDEMERFVDWAIYSVFSAPEYDYISTESGGVDMTKVENAVQWRKPSRLTTHTDIPSLTDGGLTMIVPRL